MRPGRRMGPRCICPWDGLLQRRAADPMCPATDKHSEDRPPLNATDRALPPQGYLEDAVPQTTQSRMEFRGWAQ